MAQCLLYMRVQQYLQYKLHFKADYVLSALSLFLWATAYLNDVATERPPQALLFRIVELIIGEVPRVLHFRLGHVLS